MIMPTIARFFSALCMVLVPLLRRPDLPLLRR